MSEMTVIEQINYHFPWLAKATSLNLAGHPWMLLSAGMTPPVRNMVMADLISYTSFPSPNKAPQSSGMFIHEMIKGNGLVPSEAKVAVEGEIDRPGVMSDLTVVDRTGNEEKVLLFTFVGEKALGLTQAGHFVIFGRATVPEVWEPLANRRK